MNTFLAIFFNTQKCVNKKQAKKVFHHTSREKKIIAKNRASLFRWKVFCMNNLFSLLHDASLKAAVFSGCTFWRFHIFRFWNYPIIGNFHFALKKCGNTTQRKGRRICLNKNEHNLYRVEDSISELLCKDIKYLTKSQAIW